MRVKFNAKIAKQGQMIFYSGDSNRKFDEMISESRQQKTGEMMKNIWLDFYNENIEKLAIKQKPKNQK